MLYPILEFLLDDVSTKIVSAKFTGLIGAETSFPRNNIYIPSTTLKDSRIDAGRPRSKLDQMKTHNLVLDGNENGFVLRHSSAALFLNDERMSKTFQPEPTP